MPKKQQNKGPKKKVNLAPKRPPQEPVFVYTSACCGLKAIKPALVKTAEAEGTLGTWRCSGCGKVCKCARSKAKTDKIATVDMAAIEERVCAELGIINE